jgi:pimeloyl-ACP methyl ester carboxylesterase
VSAERVVLLGQSIGGSVALELAARGHGVALILLCPFSSLSAMVDVAFPIVTPVCSITVNSQTLCVIIARLYVCTRDQALRLFPFMLLDKFDNLAKAEAGVINAAQSHHDSTEGSSASRRIPILLAHGTEDEIVPFEQGAFHSFTRCEALCVHFRGEI